ncbi:hypothetical protein C471_04145 [Halorubrum saccharovorum DSM 1137]|uniref:Peptidase M23 n=1 Tax=Halorubrum saccharovorum DSM 1137 TaxID=1227484 RepID=M0E343_9EURY|nr:hypothetical protein [Halorubrum saccharovorum]ELZ42201.1 hypothetical protein C471_04145 [Halorubrum saccharovorum DSM 1137]
MAVTLPSAVLDRYRRFSRFNSPYPAHDDGRAIDLYPDGETGVSPVAGVVRETRTVGCPDRPYAADEDHLIVVELGDDWCRRTGATPGTLARILHVIPEVSPGDRVAVGDPLGPLTRSGFFGRWVDDHVHLGFRPPSTNAVRASGSLAVDVDVPVEPVRWDGTGTVVERGPTHVVLDAPTHPDPGRRFAALASDDGVPLDGGLAHYAGGGAFDALADGTPVSLWGTRVGVARGRGLAWEPVDVLANGERAVGLSLFAARDGEFGAKLVCPDRRFELGETVSLALAPSDDPIRLGVG